MNKSLYDELTELRYISINELDPLETPETVVLYFNNLADTNTKISIESIYGSQLDLLNQNPTIELEDNSALVCLAPASYTPVVTIDPIPNYLDPSYPVSITFTGTISITDTHIPGDILVTYSGITKKAFLETNTTWTVTYSLREVTKESLEKVTAIANSIDINNPEAEGGFSLPVEETFKILFTIPEEEPECVPVTDKISCICLNPEKSYRITIDNQEPFTGTFIEVVQYLDSQKMYAYPGGLECDPCALSSDKFTISRIFSRPPPM